MSITPDDPTLNAELRRDEGVEYTPYLDTVGVPTVGVGHNMHAQPLPLNWKFPLTDTQVNTVLQQDMIAVFTGLDKNIPWWATLSPGRQRCLANMAFQLGVAGLMGFTTMLKCVKERRYTDAVAAMRASKWHMQAPGRAERMCALMLGTTP